MENFGKILSRLNRQDSKRDASSREAASRQTIERLQPDFVWHGTTTLHLEDILAHGLRGGQNLTEQRRGHVEDAFLTTSLISAEGYAGRSKNMYGGERVIFRIANTKRDLIPWKPTKPNGTIFTTKSIEPIQIVEIIYPDRK